MTIHHVGPATIDDSERFSTNLCLQRVRMCYGIAARYPTAYDAWIGAGGRNGRNTHYTFYKVQGMPIFMKGSGAAGHVCIYDKDGYVWTTDYPRKGRWNRVRLDDLAKAWRMKILGGSETLNGVRVLPHKQYEAA